MSKKKVNSAYFKQENVFFILYDFYDNVVCYFDNVFELISFYRSFGNNTCISDITYLFNRSSYDYIQFQRFDDLCKLYFYTDDELENVVI